jgi:hypothetical protein
MLVTVGSVWRVRVASSVPTSTHEALATELRDLRAELPVAAAVASEGAPETLPLGIAPAPARADVLAKAQAFQDWLTAWRRADASAQSDLAATGVELARERRTALKHLIQTDPRLALELAVPVGLRAELPAAVRAQLETRLDARGDFNVSVACTHNGGHGSHAESVACESTLLRQATIAGQNYAAHVFGRRETQTTKHGLPLHGIAVDGVAAFAETPFRMLDDAEKAAHALPLERPAVLVGELAFSVATSAEFDTLTARLVAAESVPGPTVVSLGDTDSPVTRVPGTAAVDSPPSWIFGEKRVLWVKLEFADDPGSPVTDATLAATAAEVNTAYQGVSNGRTSMTFTTLPALIRLPRDKAYYSSSSGTTGELHNDAKAAAKAYDVANGGTGAHDPDKYDRYILLFKRVPAYTFGGLGNLGGPAVWLNNSFGASVTFHELGHNHSLNHSHAWLPSSTSAIGPGTKVEYGDVFDRMGGASSPATGYFNAAQKFKLGYLDATSVTTVTTGGTYRITRHDHKDSTGIRGLRVGASNVEYEFWVEHRRVGSPNLTAQQLDRLQNGVVLHWGPQKLPNFAAGPGSYLLDTTPGSAGAMNDAPLRIGETFTDPNAGIALKPLAVGGTAPNEYIDVQVSFGATDGNRNPILTAEAPAGPLNARTNLIVSASATDPDGDPVYYRWDFGDGKFQPNLNTVTTRFEKGGTYPVTVSAHDGKGGVAIKNYTLNVIDPLVTWTKRTSPLTTNTLYSVVYAGGKFVAVGDNGAIVSSADGTTWARATTPSNAHFYRGVAHDGTRFVTVGVAAAGAAVRATGAHSGDGVTWTAATMPAGVAAMNGLAYGAGRFVAVGETGRIFTSINGAAWTETASPVTNNLRAVTYANGLFVAAGDSGRVLSSSDGLAWINRSLPDTNNYAGVAYHDGAWFIMSGPLWVYTSTDGATWRRLTTSGGVNLFTNKALSTSGVLMATHGEGRLQFSANGQNWANVQLDTATGYVVRGLAEGAGVLVAVGNTASIYSTTVPALVAPPLAAPAMRLEGASLKLAVGRKNIIAAGGAGYTRLELYANGTKVSEISGASGTFAWTPSAIGNYALTIRGIDASGASAMSASYPAQAGLASWNWRNPGPVGADLISAARIDGKWWMVGNTGNIVTLDAAGQLNTVDFATTQNLAGIDYADGRYVIVGPYTDAGSREPVGNPWISSDGFAWTALYTATIQALSLNYVTYAGGQWIGVTNGLVVTSADGVAWARRTVPVTTTLLGAAHGNNLYVVVGAGGKIITSPDGVSWTERTSGVPTDLRKVAFNNGTFVATGFSGVILSSADGITWTRRTSGVTVNLQGVGVIKGSFVVVGDAGTVLTSADAVTWTQASVENRTSGFFGAAGADNEGVLFGRAGEIYTAITATSYKRVNQGTSDSRNNVIYAGGKFVAVGQAIDPLSRNAVIPPVSVSSDGITWTRANANAGFSTLNDVTYAQSRYVAVGDAGRIFTSPDALTWTERATGSTTQRLAIGASPTLFVAAGASGSLLTSADGTQWTGRTSGTTSALRSATFGNNRYVVVGDAGTILTSADGITWAAATSGITTQLLNVGYFDSLGFLAAGASGVMLNSADGLTWRTVETGVADTIYSIAQTSIGFLAPAGTAGTMLMSLDGTNWSIGTIAADRAVRGIAANASTIVAVGDNGAILTYDLVDATPAPTVAAAPRSQIANPGEVVRLSVTAQNTSGAAYQWFKDGTPLVGANGPTYATTTAGANLGSYTVAITTPTGTVTSAAAVISLANATNPGRLVNLSLLTAIESATDSFTMGTVIGGSGTLGTQPVLIRAAGPALGALGVGGTLADPNLEFFAGSAKVGENDNWAGGAALSNAFVAVGAFPYAAPTSKDAAIFNPAIAPGGYSIRVTGNGGATGTVIAELYDSTPSAAFTSTTPRLINVSVLKQIGSGFTVGFVIGGATPRTVLVRAVGPGLAAVGVTSGFVADPRLALFAGSTKINESDDWGGAAALATAMAQVGAFAIPASSRDAALLATLQPGSYSVQVSAPAGTGGLVIAEVYEVP